MANKDLPLGIRNFNPGNLRSAYGMKYPTKLNEGFAVFNDLTDGVQAMAALIFDMYSFHGCTSLLKLIQRYAPATENDVMAYYNMAKAFITPSVNAPDPGDLDLTNSFKAVKLFNAIVRVEQGVAPSTWPCQPQWIGLNLWSVGMARSNRWSCV